MREENKKNQSGQDCSEQLLDQVRDAIANKSALNIVGGNSKSFLGRSCDAAALNTSTHAGIVNYEPTELVVTVRTGTPMQSLNALLAENGQMLPFEPPVFGNGTIGGVLACGLSGPARPFVGSARDYVLGMRVINGQGDSLRFGGEVMKNVAGYDAARLQVGAYGSLGVLLETSMKVLPIPESEITVCCDVASSNDNNDIIELMRKPLPMSAAAIVGSKQYIRLSGSASAVNAAAKTCRGDILNSADVFWQSIRELNHEFFTDDRPLWRISVPEFSPPLELDGDWLLDWAGAQRFLKSNEPAERIYQAAKSVNGHASCYSSASLDKQVPLFQPLEGAMLSLQKRVRDSFDANRIFNPGRFHPELDS